MRDHTTLLETSSKLVSKVDAMLAELDQLPEDDKVDAINRIKTILHSHSPFNQEPVDCVIWVRLDQLVANDYNPNTVAPPEMKLLQRSIEADGYTQPIVAWRNGDIYEVVDGFHRNRIGRECKEVRERIKGYLPITVANTDRTDRGDRIAATIRHNRARGKHQIKGMSDIVLELKRRNWSDAKIGRELGMEPDEVLRLAQITGLAEMFADRDFSEAWEAEASNTIDAYDDLAVEGEGVNE